MVAELIRSAYFFVCGINSVADFFLWIFFPLGGGRDVEWSGFVSFP